MQEKLLGQMANDFFCNEKNRPIFFQKIQNGREKSKLYCNAKASLGETESFMIERK